MALPLSKLPVELLRELRRWRWAALALSTLVAFAVLLVGFIYPYEYRSQVAIYLDNTNIIRPLMEGSAEITGINDQASAARELLWSRRILDKIAADERIYGDANRNLTVEQQERLYSQLRRGIDVRPQGKSYFSIRYQDYDPRQAYLIAQRLGQLFLEETNRRKREESRNAFDFIDKQVQSYERQIQRTEEAIQQFLSRNLDGTEGDVTQRINQLRRQIEDAQLEKQEVIARRQSLSQQLARVPAMTSAGGITHDGLGERIENLEKRLDEIRLLYHDTYPDVITLKAQIAELRQRQEQLAQEPQAVPDPGSGEQRPNPLYQELQTEISKAQTWEQSLETRITALNRRLESEQDRMGRIQENRSEYAELTRDLQVNQDIFNDLLRRRERARVSMHLDVEGQGLSFQIHEQAQYPLSPSGLQFETFASVGWLLGLLAPFGLLAGLLQIDPRVRSEQQIKDFLEIPLLGTIPPVRTPYERRRSRRGLVGIGVVTSVIVGAYITVVVLQGTGVLT
ncbi:MAG: lipopolysaccharide biosynthesis protein [Halomonadaceae bacterium]|nr:MAG: lipopolysaccharide biosynthesis protein [Halomonadaceae bacterium]